MITQQHLTNAMQETLQNWVEVANVLGSMPLDEVTRFATTLSRQNWTSGWDAAAVSPLLSRAMLRTMWLTLQVLTVDALIDKQLKASQLPHLTL